MPDSDADIAALGFAHHGFVALRTPLLAFDELVALTAGLAAGTASETALDDAVARDRTELRTRLRALIERPEIVEALFLASPSLVAMLDDWRRNSAGPDAVKVERTLYKYMSRMAGRSTPFGLFASVSVGRIGSATRLSIGGRDRLGRHTRFDMDYIARLALALEADPEIRSELRVFRNSSIYRVGDQLRYARAHRSDTKLAYRLAGVAPTPYLEATLDRARCGARPAALAHALVLDNPEIEASEADGYIAELIASQLLVSELAPGLIGAVPARDMAAVLRATTHGAATAVRLAAAQDRLEAIDARGLGRTPAEYAEIRAMLEPLPAEPRLERLVQVDMTRRTPELEISESVIAEIVRAVRVMARLATTVDQLAAFRQAFVARYEARELPLVEVLDEECGIGFETTQAELSPLLDGVPIGTQPDPTPARPSLQGLVIGQLLPRSARRIEEIVLAAAALEPMLASTDLLPDAWSAHVTLIAESAEAIDRGDYRVYLQDMWGPSGARALGRFCHGDDELLERVRIHLRAEEALQPDAIFAEVVHLPDGRPGNIVSRPVLRTHEICYLGRGAATEDHQIPIDDLLISVAGDRVVLRSRRLGREVVPRLTSAHDYTRRSLTLYRFLCAMQRPFARPFPDPWGTLNKAVYMPRLRIGRAVVALARWTLRNSDLDSLRRAKATSGARFRAVRRLREQLDLPRWVVMEDGSDNGLIVDLDCELAVDTFVQWSVDRAGVTLSELYPGPTELPVTGEQGRYVHELVVPFVRTLPPRSASDETRTPDLASARTIMRSFAPGGEWLYLKIYAGQATLDQILVDVIAPCVADAQASGASVRWFFIRYGDPHWHLRVRLGGDAQRLNGEVLPALHAALAALRTDGRVWRVQCDTYEREVERYAGAAGMLLSERVFDADSEAAVRIIAELRGFQSPQDVRWQLAFAGLHALLQALGLSVAERRAACDAAREIQRRNVGDSEQVGHAIGRKFRAQRAQLEALLTGDALAAPDMASVREALADRDAKIAVVADELRTAQRAGTLHGSIPDLAISYMHMSCNRLFRSAANAHELVLYDFLERIYLSRIKRGA